MKNFYAKHDLEVQVIDFVSTNGIPAMLGFFFVKTGYFALAGYSLFFHRHASVSKTLPCI